MNKIKLACLTSLLAATVANAATPCDGFQIRIENNTIDSLIAKKIHLSGADIQSGGIEKANGKSSEIFTVSNSTDVVKMRGEMIFSTLENPSKTVKVKFTLTYDSLVCKHTDNSPKGGGLALQKTRVPGSVTYTLE